MNPFPDGWDDSAVFPTTANNCSTVHETQSQNDSGSIHSTAQQPPMQNSISIDALQCLSYPSSLESSTSNQMPSTFTTNDYLNHDRGFMHIQHQSQSQIQWSQQQNQSSSYHQIHNYGNQFSQQQNDRHDGPSDSSFNYLPCNTSVVNSIQSTPVARNNVDALNSAVGTSGIVENDLNETSLPCEILDQDSGINESLLSLNLYCNNTPLQSPEQSMKLTPIEDFETFNRMKELYTDNLLKLASELDGLWMKFSFLHQSTIAKVLLEDQNEKIPGQSQECMNKVKTMISMRELLVEEKNKILSAESTIDTELLNKKVFADAYFLKCLSLWMIALIKSLEQRKEGFCQEEKKIFQVLKKKLDEMEKKSVSFKNKGLTQNRNFNSEAIVSEANQENVLKGTKEIEHVGKHGAGKVNIGKRKKRSVETSKTRKQTKKTKVSSSIPQNSLKTAKNNHGPDATIIDKKADRLVNPLLELPQGSMNADTMLPVSEYLKLMEIYFPEPDTFPLSFYAQLLGIDNIVDDDKQVSGETKTTKADEWMKIPSLGKYARVPYRLCNSILESIDENGSKVSHRFDFVDPMWIAILRNYRGYNDSYFKQATELNASRELSVECLTLARDLMIIDPKISFRHVTEDDFSRFSDFVKNETKLDFSALESKLNAGNHFIILALFDTQDVIGFIHYQFCWFRPSLKRFQSSDDAALERVVHIESCHTKQIHGHETKASTVVLFSLALEHARFHAGYGMMKLQSSIAPLLKSYFRMNEVSQSVSDSDGCLACDLEKCSFKFALHKLRVKKDPCSDHDIKIRILVQMPTYREVIESQSFKNGKAFPKKDHNDGRGYGIVGDTLEESNVEKLFKTEKQVSTKAAVPRAKTFYSIKQKTRKKPVRIRIERDELKVIKSPLKSDKKSLQGVIDTHDWRIISFFENTDSSMSDSQHDTVLSELRKHQEKLMCLETKNSAVLKHLFDGVMKERYDFELGEIKKSKEVENVILESYKTYVQRCLDSQKAFEAKLEEDENAVCDICGDGESSGENRIIFCDCCDVSVHQHCYGVDTVPHGDYFCRACEYYKKNKGTSLSVCEDALKSKSKAPYLVKCELCPKLHGAFVQTQVIENPKGKESADAKWVHFLCAKWQGLKILENVTDGGRYDLMVENVQPIKDHFRTLETRCYLCKGMRGSYNKCRHEGCDRWMHVTCARSSGICEVIHGDDHIGPVDSPLIWTLSCPEHSKFDENYISPSNKVPLDELVALAKTFPVEPKPAPPPEPPKPFHKMTGKERKQKLKDPEYEFEICQSLIHNRAGARCEICDLTDTVGQIITCASCSAVAHVDCLGLNSWDKMIEKGSQGHVCNSCVYKRNEQVVENYEPPFCNMCQSQTGTLIPCSAKPMSMKKWKANMKQFQKSYFGRAIWCHPICGIWHPKTIYEQNGVVNCTNVIMANGTSHIEGNQACGLCGIKTGLKIQCKHTSRNKKVQCHGRFHATCARQAGFEISSDNPEVEMAFMCYRHGRCDYAFRALLEDMIEFEKIRSGNDLSRSGKPMTWECASKIFSAGVRVMRCLGWAWQWCKWWVVNGDNWEPLLEEGQIEAKMTKEELKIVESTVTSRRADARRCRLAAFGAALRNRDYDKEPGDDRRPLHNALRGILSTPSLVGPLTNAEIEFFVEWLGRVYRSKSVLLGFGPDKLPVKEHWESDSTVHYKDKTPKYELGDRTLPGKHVRNGYLFEQVTHEMDDLSDDDFSTPRNKGSTVKMKSNTSDDSKVPLENCLDAFVTADDNTTNQPPNDDTAKPSETCNASLNIELVTVEKEVKSPSSAKKKLSLDDPIPRKKRTTR